MIKKVILFLLAVFICTASFSQIMDTKDSSTSFNTKYTIYLNSLYINSGIQFSMYKGWTGRLELTSNTTIGNRDFGYATPISLEKGPYGILFELANFPFLERNRKNGKLKNNFNGFYIGFISRIPFKTEVLFHSGGGILATTVLGITPGYRTSFLKHGYFNIQLGPALSYVKINGINDFGSTLPLTADIGLGVFLSVPKYIK